MPIVIFLHRARAALLAAVAWCATASAEDAARLTETEFASVQGGMVSVPAPKSKATVLLFVSSTCPIANGYAPEINRLVETYGPQGVSFRIIHTEPELTLEEARTHLKEFKYSCPVLLDPKRALVRATGVTITPEVAVLSPTGKRLYRGRIDDRFPAIGIQRDAPKKRDLCEALDAVLAGRPVLVERTVAIGCLIE